ncbi:hypothetical protein FQN53_005356 [Emmonsiellopsis sp. PD_33]|nr:hypothetical protein FQN53_005356 [Emmonsiellopsis sp. PD_33]
MPACKRRAQKSPPKKDTEYYSPAMPIPPVFDVDERIRELEEARDPNSPFCEREEFWPNIPTLIKLYKEGKMPDPNVKPTYLRDGKVITEEEYRADPSWAWKEFIEYQL